MPETDTDTAPHTPNSTRKKAVFHMIGNAHIDPVWLWNWQEGFQEVKATYRSALDRMKEYPDFVFTCSSAAHYAWVEENDPQMFKEIQDRVKEGRWEIVGGWWVQPDCNLPSGEGFVRQGLIGQRYFLEKFGVTAKVGYNPDSFGHTITLPQILKKSGMPYYTFMRPGPHEQGLPSRLFHWESPDGSRVLTFRIPYEYCTWGKNLETHIKKCTTEIPDTNELMVFYGVGNHGGGPTRENIDSIVQLNEDPSLPELTLSSPNRYFAAVEKREKIPVWSDELQLHAVGCYAAHSGIKQWVRKAENMLIRAEKFAALAHHVTGQPYPKAEFTRAWKNVLFNHFHDILAGTSIESAYDDARNELGEALSIASRALNFAVQSMSWKVNIPMIEGTKPIVVFNPHAWDATLPIEMEYGGLKPGDVLTDDQGREVPYQTVRSEATVSGWRKRITFMADLPALGYRTFRMKPGEAQEAREPRTDLTLENEFLKVTFDEELGGISSIWDKEQGLEVLKAPAARGAIFTDTSDTWSHGILRYDQLEGYFSGESLKVVEEGPVKRTIRIRSVYQNSTLIQDVSLFTGSRHLEVKVTLDWHEKHSVLKLLFPLMLHFPQATYEVPYGTITRPADENEKPGQTWLDLSGVYRATGSIYGVSLINDAKASYSIQDTSLALTVLRSPIYAHHDPYVPSEEKDHRYMDQGEQRFTYLLHPHTGTWRDAKTVQLSQTLNQPAVAIIETYHDGPLPQSQSFVRVDAKNVVLSVVKQAEAGEDLVLRLIETSGQDTSFRLEVLGQSFEHHICGYEIKTLMLKNQQLIETDLLEQL
ncbi:alpha-mannosidase [Deinococcus cellulosilyticus]|uniref:Alpha-mannosidase n=1 Tax=Deinococcus cellulosilyticus (strain DSM 18568 / NBRC 106333 / KACC 11606 / 5516J-15) TaxID=1223518 RepID=A0A511N1R6_DEIC1|nr:alpha-mannosidase [Deinococcus cellulosilyticus]GEM46769.1 alpha-mannosidase [Deinococcus cellulosilyticus NBRC 106333 = KACC 11606]